MRFSLVPVCLALFLTAPARAQFHQDAHRAYEEHWRAHPEHPDELVRSWHKRLFRRDIPEPLLRRWVGELRGGIAPSLALAHILASPEYFVMVGSTPEGFVRRAFTEIVGRPPTESEFHFWVHRLYHGDRAEVAYELVTRYPPAWIAEEPAPVEHYEYRRPISHYPR